MQTYRVTAEKAVLQVDGRTIIKRMGDLVDLSDDVARLNAARLEPCAAPESSPAPSVEPESSQPAQGPVEAEAPVHFAPIHALSVAEAHQLIVQCESLDQLDAYQRAELRNEKYPDGRAGVLRAIETRRRALAGR